MTKVYGITDKDFFTFIKKINEFNSKNNVVATQIHNHNGVWFAIIYYSSNHRQGLPSIKSGKSLTSFSLATHKQIYFLEQHNIKVPKELTKFEASEMIKELKKDE